MNHDAASYNALIYTPSAQNRSVKWTWYFVLDPITERTDVSSNELLVAVIYMTGLPIVLLAPAAREGMKWL